MNMLKKGDILIEAATGKEYRVWWCSKTRCTAISNGSFNTEFHRDTTNGIRTYPKSNRVFTLKAKTI
jgi:hypothetical protein